MLETITSFVKENKEYFIGAAVGAGVTLGGVGAVKLISNSKAKKEAQVAINAAAADANAAAPAAAQ